MYGVFARGGSVGGVKYGGDSGGVSTKFRLIICCRGGVANTIGTTGVSADLSGTLADSEFFP